jgi:choline dehydrogenase-like flavoprotein
MATPLDVILVGAGPAGCLLAEALAHAGLRVRLIDAGPRLSPGAPAPEVDRRAWSFQATEGSFDWYRVRAVGGRSLLWGGWCHRFPESVFRRAAWRTSARALAPDYRAVERELGVVRGPIDARVQRAARALEVRVEPKRAPLVGERIWTARDLASARTARTDTVALRLEHERGVAVALVALDLRTGKEIRLRARAIVLAASPIETARILLESELDDARDVGKNLVDHMVASYALVEPLAPPTPAAGTHAHPLAHHALVDPGVNADATSARSYRGAFTLEVAGPVPLEAVGLERMVAGDEVDRHRATLIHAMGEVFASRRRYVDLAPPEGAAGAERARDAYGRRTPRIHFAWTREDERRANDMKRACIAFADALAAPGSRLIPFVDPLAKGAGHEAGTCAAPGLLDDAGRMRALANVWIGDASWMPTAGDRHPTLTLLAHALGVARAVARSLARAAPRGLTRA